MADILHVLDMLAWFPENISTFGAELDNLFALVYYLSVAIFLLTFGILGVFLVKYRHREGHRGYNYHGNNVVELTWTILPTILFAGLGIYTDSAWELSKYSGKVPKADVEMLVLGKQFGWYAMYPGADGQFGRNAYTDRSARHLMSTLNPFGIDSTDPAGFDDFVTENQFKIPVNSNVVLKASSIDVLHSFFLPHMRVKQDVVPGLWMTIWFNSFKTGKYELACAELCGGGHYSMRAEYEVLSQTAYDKWLDQKNSEVKQLRAMSSGETQPAVVEDSLAAPVAESDAPADETVKH